MEPKQPRKEIISNEIFFETIRQQLDSGQRVTLLVKGVSMQPTLLNGRHSVVLMPAQGVELSIGCIALFLFEGRYLLHRLVEIQGAKLIFQGDNVHKTQEWAMREDVVGVVERIVDDRGESIDCLTPQYARESKRLVGRLKVYHTYRYWLSCVKAAIRNK